MQSKQSPTFDSPQTDESLSQPDKIDSYDEIRIPSWVAEHSTKESLPSVTDQLTIPGNHIDHDALPWNGRGLDWRSYRAKYATISQLYPLAASQNPEYNDCDVVHCVLSPPPEDIQSVSDIRHWRAKTGRVAQEMGIIGGVGVFHGYRVKEEVATNFEEYISETKYADTATDVLLWEFARQHGWRNVCKWGPHIHIVGLAHWVDTDMPGAVCKVLRWFDEYDCDLSTPTSDLTSDTFGALSQHRAVGKDMVDHLTFNTADPLPPLSWFGMLKGDSWCSAAEHASKDEITRIRSHLIASQHKYHPGSKTSG